VPACRYAFGRSAWFADDVLWLAPEDPGPFRELTHRVHAQFPRYPTFGGAFADVVPHLTVGHRHPRPVLAAAEQQLQPALPVTGEATEVVLLVQPEPGGRWATRTTFPLGC
jgi:2'-5' RNA ligase superfamily